MTSLVPINSPTNAVNPFHNYLFNRSLQNHEVLEVHLSHQSPMIPNPFSSHVQTKLPVDRHQHSAAVFQRGNILKCCDFPENTMSVFHCKCTSAFSHYSPNLTRFPPSNSLFLLRGSALHLIKQNLFYFLPTTLDFLAPSLKINPTSGYTASRSISYSYKQNRT